MKLALKFLALIFLCCLIIFPYRKAALLENEGSHLTVAQELSHGAKLYTDIWDHKPPLLYLHARLAQKLFPGDPENVRFYLIFIHIINALLVGALAVRLFKDDVFWPAAFSYAALASPPVFLMWTFEADLLMLPCLLAAFVAASSESKAAWYWAGTWWTAAFFTKQTALFYLPMFLVLRKKERLSAFMAFVLAADAVALLVVLPFAIDGRAKDFWEAVSGYGGSYMRNGWLSVMQSQSYFDYLFAHLLVPAGLSYGALAVYLALQRKKISLQYGSAARQEFFITWGLCSLAMCCASGLFLNYYFMVFVPLLALGVALAWRDSRHAYGLGFLVAGPALAWLLLAGFQGTDKTVADVFALTRCTEVRVLGLQLKKHGAENGRLFAWGESPQLYVYSGARVFEPRSLFMHHLYSEPGRLERLQTTFKDGPPEWVTVSAYEGIPQEPGWLSEELEKNYVRQGDWGAPTWMPIFRRKQK